MREEGFIHCSDPPQLKEVADRLFRGRGDLVLLVVDPARLVSQVRLENLEGGEEMFPHVYGPIEIEAVIDVRPFVPRPDGTFEVPKDLRSRRV